ncbi:MAG: hypothetical protein WCA44_12160 [Acidobacteriaceae bacterium]
MPSSSATRPRKGVVPRKRAKEKGSTWSRHALWPLLICVAVDPFVVRAASILALEGPRPFTMLYPWVEFLYLPAFHFTAEMVSTLQQWVLYLQFPVYGLLMTLAYRADKKFRALNFGLAAHFGGILLVELFSYFGR